MSSFSERQLESVASVFPDGVSGAVEDLFGFHGRLDHGPEISNRVRRLAKKHKDDWPKFVIELEYLFLDAD